MPSVAGSVDDWDMGSTTSFATSKGGRNYELESALGEVAKANQLMDSVQQQLRESQISKKQQAYVEAQEEYRRKREEQRAQAKQAREQYSGIVKEQAQQRLVEERRQVEQLQATTVERLKQLDLKKEAEELRMIEEARFKQEAQARWKAAHLRKKKEEEDKVRAEQMEIAAEREAEKVEVKQYNEAKEQRRVESMAAMRRVKEEAWAREKADLAEQKAKAEAETRARFKESEAARIRVEALRRKQERADARTAREALQKKVEREQREKAEEKAAAAAALKQALAEAKAAAYEQDERGKMVLKLDPTQELKKKMRLLEAEQQKMQEDRDAELAAKEKAFQLAKKEQERERELQVQAAQREVAATFKMNKEKELRDRLAREAAEKERCRILALEMREKIDAENQRKLAVEKEMEQNLKDMKAAQYDADLAAHKRSERMKLLKAKNARGEQETAWEDVMEWNETTTQKEARKKLEAMAHFSGTRQHMASKDVEEELREQAASKLAAYAELEREYKEQVKETTRVRKKKARKRAATERANKASWPPWKLPSERDTGSAPRSPKGKPKAAARASSPPKQFTPRRPDKTTQFGEDGWFPWSFA